MGRSHSTRTRPGRWQAAALVFALALPWLPGCGDGLLGADGVRNLVGLDELNLPTQPAWRIRWMLDEDFVDGPPHEVAPEAVFLDYTDDEDTWFHYVNYLEVEKPGLTTPPAEAIRDFGSWSFAVGVPMLLDDVDANGDWVTPSDTDPEELWGATPESAFFYFNGDLGQLMEWLPVEPWGESWNCDCPIEIHEGLQPVQINHGALADWEWRQEWEDLEEWEQACLEQQEAFDACVEEFDPESPECEEEMWALDECMQQWEWGWFTPVLFPDHIDIDSTFRPGALRVEAALTLDNFPGGVRAFLSEAWWAWFSDPKGLI